MDNQQETKIKKNKLLRKIKENENLFISLKKNKFLYYLSLTNNY